MTVDGGVLKSFFTVGEGIPYSRSLDRHKTLLVSCGPRFTFCRISSNRAGLSYFHLKRHPGSDRGAMAQFGFDVKLTAD
jgi:hypothetical protein